MDLGNKTVIITGGSSGLGFSVAKALLEKSCFVHILAHNEENLAQAAESLDSEKLHTHLCDVADFESVHQVVTTIGDSDILINCAGVWHTSQLVDCQADAIDKLIDTNLKGTIYTTRLVLPYLLKKEAAAIINVSSTHGLKVTAETSIYDASKWGVAGFTKAMQVELWDSNVKVIGFYPGGMRTNFFKKGGDQKDNKGWMNTDKVADIIVFALEQDETMSMDEIVLNKRVKQNMK